MSTFRSYLSKPFHTAIVILLVFSTLPLPAAARATAPRAGPAAEPASAVALPPLVEEQASIGPARRSTGTVELREDSQPPDTQVEVGAAQGDASMMFIENVGQFPDGARFQVRGGDRTVWLAEDGVWVTLMEPMTPTLGLAPEDGEPDLGREMPQGRHDEDQPRRGVNLKLSFPDANPHARLEPFNRLDTHVSYFIGNDPARWRADVPVWGGVRYVDVYPGVDLEMASDGGSWAWRLACRTDCQSVLQGIRLRVDGADTLDVLPSSEAEGGPSLPLAQSRGVSVATVVGDFTLPLLQAVDTGGIPLNLGTVQPEVNGLEIIAPFSQPLPAKRGLRAELALTSGERSASSVLNEGGEDIPSDLLYSTFLGGSSWDEVRTAAVDGMGNAYVAGVTNSTDFPTTPGAYDTTYNDTGGAYDIFVAELKTGGAGLVYATFLGGSLEDQPGWGMAIDESGAAYVTGLTKSSDFPLTPGAYDTTHNGSEGTWDACVVKLNADGTSLAYATFLGGSSSDAGFAVALDWEGNAYVTGETYSSDFPVPGAYDSTHNGGWDVFVAKLNTNGTNLIYATFLGGGGEDNAYGIAVDASRAMYVTGYTKSSDFPTTPGAYDISYNGGESDAFVTKLDASGTVLSYSTFLGGNGKDRSHGITVDRTGNAYVAGITYGGFPTTSGAFDTSYNGDEDAFVTKLIASGTVLSYSTYLGGSGWDDGRGIVIDWAGSAYVTGATCSTDFPTTPGAYDTTPDTNGDAFIFGLSADGTSYYASFLGGNSSDVGLDAALDGAGNIYVTGYTQSSDFPTTPGAYDTVYNGGDRDAFMVAFNGSTLPWDQTLCPCECPFGCSTQTTNWRGGPINTHTGNYHYGVQDFSIPALGQPLRFERSYNSLVVTGSVVYSQPLGTGWTHNYDLDLTFPGDPGGEPSTVIVKACRGSRFRFADNGDGTYVAFPGVWATLTRTVGAPYTYTLTGVDQSTYTFDNVGHLVEIRSPQGQAIALSYTAGRLARVADSTGLRYLDFSYDGQGRLAEVRDPTNRTVRYGYGAVGDLAVVTDTRNLAWTYTYTGTHLLYDVRDPLGQTIERTDYDSQGRAVRQWQGDLSAQPLQIEYGPTGVITITDPLGHVTVDGYSVRGLLAAQSDAAGASSRTYDAYFNWTSTTDANSNTTDYTFNPMGQPEQIADAQGNATQMTYDSLNHLTVVTDALTHSTRYEYQGNLLAVITDTLEGTVVNSYDERGLLIQAVDHGITTTYGYDTWGQRVVVTPTLGVPTYYVYDAVGRLSLTVQGEWMSCNLFLGCTPNPDCRITLYQYDAADNLVRATQNPRSLCLQNAGNECNLITEHGYDQVGRRVVTTDTLGSVTRSWYDTAGWLISVTANYSPTLYPGHGLRNDWNLTTRYGYDAMGRQVLVTDTLGSVSYTEYDAVGRVARTWQNYLPGQPQNYQGIYNLVTAYGYDAVGNQILVTDTLGSVTRNWYDELNRTISVTVDYSPTVGPNYQNQWNLTTWYGYDQVGNQVLVTDTLGRVTFTEYDALNRPITVTTNYVNGVFNPAYPDEDLLRVTTYDAAGRVFQVTDQASRITRYEYDALGRQTAVIQNYENGVFDPAQPDRDLRSETVYDDLGQMAARVQLSGTQRISTTYTYNSVGRLITVMDALSSTTVTHYDALGRRTETIDAEGQHTRYEYDAVGRLVTTTNALTGTFVTRYDVLGRRVATTDPLTHTTVYTYDAAGRLIAQADPLGAVTRYGYDVLGRRTVVTDADGVALYSVYDTLGRLVETRDVLGHSTRYNYDGLGNRTVMTDANGIATRYSYDDAGRLITVTENYSVTGPVNFQTNVRTVYAYDASGNLVGVTDALTHTTVYTYDLAGRRVAEADALGNVTRFEYDGLGRRVGEVYPDAGGSITVTSAYNLLGWPTRIDYPAVGDVPGFSVEVGYDALGHREVVSDATGATTYDYSALYQPLGIAAPTGDAHYTYNAAGQRVNLVYPTGEVVTYTHGAAGRLIRVQDWAGGVTVYTYTAAGRPSGMQLPNGVVTHYEYDAAGRLVEIEHARGADVLARYEYALDAVGNRVVVTETVGMAGVGGSAALPGGSRAAMANAAPRYTGTAAAALNVPASTAEPVATAYALPDIGLLLLAPLAVLAALGRNRKKAWQCWVAWPVAVLLLAAALACTGLALFAGSPALASSANGTVGQDAMSSRAADPAVPNLTAGLVRDWRPDFSWDNSTKSEHPSDLVPEPRPQSAPVAASVPSTVDSAPTQAQLTEQVDAAGVSSDWLASVQEDMRESEYHVTWQEQTYLEDVPAAYQAPNRAHNLRTYFTTAGIRVIPRTSGETSPAEGTEGIQLNALAESAAAVNTPAWELGLALTGYGTEGDVRPVPAAELSTSDNRIEYRYGSTDRNSQSAIGNPQSAITEWYVNDERGLEQGFTLSSPPLVSSSPGLLVLEIALTGDLAPNLTQDGQAIEFTTPGGVRVLRYSDLRATDATGRSLPAHLELTQSRLTPHVLCITLNATDAVYPIAIDPVLTTPSWTAEGDQLSGYEGASFGVSVSTAGDVNGDGRADVIVGAYRYDNGQVDEGRAYVYTGTLSGLSTSPAWTAESNQTGAYFGRSVGTAGDVNGDGRADVIVGAYLYDNGQVDEGRAYVYTGTLSGLSTSPAWTAESNQGSAYFGYSVGTAGDVNGDGRADVIVGAYAYDNGQVDEGRAFVYTGTLSGLSTSPAWTAESDQASAYFGYSVGTAGNVNGDSRADVIVGAYAYDNGQTDEGRAYVYTGTLGGLSVTPAWTAESDQADSRFGWSVGTAGDVNGDGRADVIVGAYLYDNGQTDEGRAYVYTGTLSGLSAIPAWTAESDQANAYFGWSVGTAGNVNGDSRADVIVGAYAYDNGQTNEGRAYVYTGTVSGLSASPAWTAESDQANAYFGYAVNTAGDVNGDSRADVVVGAYAYDNGQTDEGRAFVYTGTLNGLSASPAWTAESGQNNSAYSRAYFGCSVSAAGDVNGDGYGDVIVGAYAYDNGQTDEGRAFVYAGTLNGLGTTPAWTAESDQAYAYFGWSVGMAGDVNGDGYGDVIVGAYLYDNGQDNEGRAYVYTGTVNGLNATFAWTAESDQASAYFGRSVNTAGDVNGDGYGDVIVGAYAYDNGQTDEGRAYVYTGTASGLSASPAWMIESDQASACFGISVGTAGDVNGDGYGDVIVGAYAYDNGQGDEGRAFVYTGTLNGLGTTPAWTAESNQTSALLGYSVSTAGDVNGDGYGDVIVGAYAYDNGQTDEGRAYVYTGTLNGLGATPAWTAESDQAYAYFGRSVSTAGDVNGDGYADVIVGALYYDNGQAEEGRATMYYGSAAGLSATADWMAEGDQDYAYFGWSVSTAGDVNGDGYGDVIVGAPYYENDLIDEGRAYVYHGSPGTLGAVSNWTAEGDQASAHFGWSVNTAGDVNGDGRADVIVGAYAYDNGQTDEGRAYVYTGTLSGLSVTPAWTAESDQAGSRFGYSVGTAGDVNGDGYADVIVGAPYYDFDLIDGGRAYVYHGSPSGLSTTPAWTVEGDRASAEFGHSVGTAGDVNGDGYADAIVGAHGYSNGQAGEGRACVYHGSASGLSTTAAWMAEGDQAYAYFGSAVGTAGDVNSDGYSDVIVGAYGYGQTEQGRAYVYHGSASGLSPTAAWTAEGGQNSAVFGFSVSTAGDVNGDGYADVIVGDWVYQNGQTEGRAFVYHGSASGLSPTAAWTAESAQEEAYLGYAVSTAGDVNGDGYADVIVGAPGNCGDQMWEGCAYVYHGSALGLSTIADWLAEGGQELAQLGLSVGAAGDVNGDGYADVVVGASEYDNDQGRAFVYYGNGGAGLALRPRQTRTDGSVQIAPLGRSDSLTSVQLRLTARTPLGREKVKLQWQVAPLGTPFTATSGVISGTSAAWTDVLTTGVVITQNVTGLTPVTPYHWRVRLLYRPGNRLGQTASRWIHMPWNGWNETDFRTPDMPITGLAATNDSPPPLGQPTTLTATVTGGTHVVYTWAFGDATTGSGQVVTHTYPAVGSYTAVVTASNGVSVVTATTVVVITTHVITYTYDPLGRLIGAACSTGQRFEYAYDAVGNRTAYTATLGTTSVTTYTYDAANRLTSAGGVAYTWDDRGNLTSDGTSTYYFYDSAGRLARARIGFYDYRRWVAVYNRTNSVLDNYPLEITSQAGTGFDHAALVAAGKAQADGDDLRVRVDGVEVDRWVADLNTTHTKVWVNMDLQAGRQTTLTLGFGAGDSISSLTVSSTAGFPLSGTLYNTDSGEAFTYNGKDVTHFLNVTRAEKDTLAAAGDVGDAIVWIEHDVWLLYGDTSASSPAVNNHYEPAFETRTSTNASWVYEEFGEDDGLRTAAWVYQDVENGSMASPYGGNQGASANPWIEIGVHVYSRNLYAAGRFYFQNPSGITNANLTNGEKFTSYPPGFTGRIESSSNGLGWTTEYTIAAPSYAAVWESWSRNEAISSTQKYVALYLRAYDYHLSAYHFLEAADCAVTLNASNVPAVILGVESSTETVVYTYTYNAAGLRVAQSVNGSVMTTTWDLALPLAQVLATGDGARDLYGPGRIAEVRGGEWAYPLGDALGSVRQWTDDAGNVTYAAGYAPYGETLWQVGSTESAWGFTGEWWDANVGLEYLRARWYDGGVGRFTQVDPIAGMLGWGSSYNPYGYADQNPVNRADPSGLLSNETIAHSFGVGSFEELLEIFDQYLQDWGYLKMLQDAKIGDRVYSGECSRTYYVGTIRCYNADTDSQIGQYYATPFEGGAVLETKYDGAQHLRHQPAVGTYTEGFPVDQPHPWYYLNHNRTLPAAYTTKTDKVSLPDYVVVSGGLQASLAIIGLGTGPLAAVDRYGYIYGGWSGNGGVSLPIPIYASVSLGWVNQHGLLSDYRSRPTHDQVKGLLEGPGVDVSANLVVGVGGYASLDSGGFLDIFKEAVGGEHVYGLPSAGVSIGLMVQLQAEPVSRLAWDWVDMYPVEHGYGRQDIRMVDDRPAECGCSNRGF